MPHLELHLVSHTHWDREWYQPAGRFRQRLVALIDELLDDPPTEGAFLLDGQTIVLEDYLAVRPERASEVASLLRARRLEAGPWYVLADELIPGAEALVRNLLVGRRTLAALRAAAPRVLYCPDSFGHPAALPELARGFGLGTTVLWRGYGGPRWPAGDAFWWRAGSGVRALVHHLPRDGYEYGSHLPLDARAAAARWARVRSELAPRATLGPVLFTHGADHHARQRDWRTAIAAFGAAVEAPDALRVSTLDDFAAALEARAADAELPEVTGELRDSYGYAWTLQGTFATRTHQKRRNAIAERLLVREAEPFAALARIAGKATRRALVDAAWKSLLRCHPHDTLCGCSIDAVARAMDARLDDAIAQGEGIRDDALLDLVGHDAAAAHGRHADWREVVVVRNAAARPRGGVARIGWSRKLRDVPVGPGSAPATQVPEATWNDDVLPGFLAQVVGLDVRHERIESPRHYPDNDAVVAADVLAWLPPVPGYGVLCAPHDARVPARPPWTVSRAGDAIEGSGLRVEADAARGEARLHVGGLTLESLLGIEDEVDAGDTYTPSIRGEGEVFRPAPDRLRAPLFGAEVDDEDGPLRASLSLAWEGERSGSWVAVRVSIEAGAPFVRIRIRGENRAVDHRLRLVISTGVRDAEVWADAAFGPVRRRPLELSSDETTGETPSRTAPLHRYVSLFGAGRGATIYSDGLAEYEVLPDGRVAVTLVRAVGELSRNDLPERPGHAGWPTPTPQAQCLGPFDAELALLLHGGVRDEATIDLVEAIADDVLLPLTGHTLRSAIDVHDAPGVALDGDGLALSAIKDAADGDWLALRCVNLLERDVAGRWTLPFEPREAMTARLDETPLAPLDVDGAAVRFDAGPRAVVTVLVR